MTLEAFGFRLRETGVHKPDGVERVVPDEEFMFGGQEGMGDGDDVDDVDAKDDEDMKHVK